MYTAAGIGPASPAQAAVATAVAFPEMFARDAVIAWFRGEFAAANAIIDSLCNHLTQIDDRRGSDYEAVFAAIHRRRMNWIPVIHMQKYVSIGDVAVELRGVTAKRRAGVELGKNEMISESFKEEIKEEGDEEREGAELSGSMEEEVEDSSGVSSDHGKAIEGSTGESGGSEGSHEQSSPVESMPICSEHEDCAVLPERIKASKGFVAKEPVKGHMVNIVKGLKLYEDIFTDSELPRLAEFINELRVAGRNGELSGDTFIFFNKQMKGNKREIIQLGVPIFQPTKEEATSSIEPIPQVMQAVIDHLVQWRLIPETRKPNSCIINFFDEGEYSQPYFKPPHLDNPISTLLMSETKMAFGRVFVSDHNGNYTGSLTLPLKEGSLLVMRGNSADMARHVICPSSNKRVTITFVRVRPHTSNHVVDYHPSSEIPPLTRAMTLWQPPLPQKVVGNGGALAYGGALDHVIPTWGVSLQSPVVMIAPPPPTRPTVMGPPGKRFARGGTGVFLPWTVGSSKKYTKHLPPRIQRRRLPSLPPPEIPVEKPSQIPCAAA